MNGKWRQSGRSNPKGVARHAPGIVLMRESVGPSVWLQRSGTIAFPLDAFVSEQHATGFENRFTTSQSGERGELRDHPFPCLNTGIKSPWADGIAWATVSEVR